jgi:MFS family permease
MSFLTCGAGFLTAFCRKISFTLLEFINKMHYYIWASIGISLGGLLNGYDTGAIGAVVTMRQYQDVIGKLSPTLLGFTVALIMLTGSLPSVFAGHFADKYGRLKVLMSGGIIFAIGTILEASAYNLSQFLVGRALAGLGEGVYVSIMSVYITEIVPVKHRGIMAGLPQFMATAGVCIGYFTCYGTVRIESSIAWRLPFIFQTIIALVFIGSCLLLPDSPRWLLLQGRRAEALASVARLDFVSPEEQQAMLSQVDQRPSLSGIQGFLLLWKRGYLSRTMLALFVLGMVQLSGIDGVLYVRNPILAFK